MIQVTVTSVRDIRRLVHDLRAWDQYEIPTMTGMRPHKAIMQSFRNARIMGLALTVKHDDNVLVCCGACPFSVLSQHAEFYAFATNEYLRFVSDAQNAVEMLETSKKICDALLVQYESLTIHVLRGDDQNMKFLRRIGWKFIEDVTLRNGVDCKIFRMEALPCAV